MTARRTRPASSSARLAAADDRLRVIDGTPLRPGWMGKAHAIVQGYQAARGDWLLFTDADTVHAPWLLSAVMSRLLAKTALSPRPLGPSGIRTAAFS